MSYKTVLKGSFLLGTLICASSAFSQTAEPTTTQADQVNQTTQNSQTTQAANGDQSYTNGTTNNQGYNGTTAGNGNQGSTGTTSSNDTKITHTLTKMIQSSKILSTLPVTVYTRQGVVYIKGNVDSDMQASKLTEDAESISGVSDVNTSELTVKASQHPLTDTYITAKVKGLFIREKLFGKKDIAAINISVETKNGIVYLSGRVDNNDQIKNAIAIIKKSVPDVQGVEYSVSKVIPAKSTNNTNNTDNTVTE